MKMVNCKLFDDGKCRAGHYNGTPSLIACGLCQHRQAIEPTKPAIMRVKGKPVEISNAPVAPDQWPDWATWLATKKAEGDRGVGDTIERLLGEGGKAFKLLWNATFGQAGLGCGCDGRRDRLNSRFAY